MASTTAEPAPAPVDAAAPPALSTSSTQLDYLIANTQMCMLRPFSFFVSWQGVLTLAYRGFPAPLVTLKEQISDFYPSLPKENPGSKASGHSIGLQPCGCSAHCATVMRY